MIRIAILLPLLFFCQISFAQSAKDLPRRIDSLYNAGYNKEVVELGKQLKRQFKTAGLPDTGAYLRAMIQLADAYKMAESWKESEILLEEIAPLAAQYTLESGLWDCEYGQIASRNGDVYLSDSLISAGIDLIEKAGKANTVIHIRGFFLRARTYAAAFVPEADSLFSDCIQRWRQAGLPDHWLLGQIYGSKAAMDNTSGNAQDGLDHVKKGLDILARCAAPGYAGNLRLKRIYFSIVVSLRDMETAEQIITDWKKDAVLAFGVNSEQYATVLENENQYQMDMGRLNDGLATALESMRIKKALKVPILIQVIADDKVADALIELGRTDEARAIHQAILDSLHTLKKPNLHYEGHAWEGLARCEEDPNKAIPMFEKAIDLFQRSLMRQDCGVDAYVLNLLIEQYLFANRLSDAARTIALMDPDTSFANKTNAQYCTFLGMRGAIRALSSDSLGALADWREMAQAWRQTIASELFLSTEFQRLEEIPTLVDISNLLLSHAVQKNCSGAIKSEVLNFQLFSKSLLLSTDLKIRQQLEHDPHWAPVFAAWKNTRERLAWCYTQPDVELKSRKINVKDLEARADSLENRINRSRSILTAETLRKAFDWTQVRDQLQPGEAALHIARYDEQRIGPPDTLRYACFIIRPGMQQPTTVFLPNGDQLEQNLTEQYLTECASPEGQGRTDALYQGFWQKLEPYLKGVSRLYVSADGTFLKINLGAIRLPSGAYVADQIDVRSVFSLKDVGAQGEASLKSKVGPKTAFLLGNPAFLLKNTDDNSVATLRSISETPDSIVLPGATTSLVRDLNDTRGITLADLPGSAQEVRDIADLLHKKGWQSTVITGLDAKEESLKSIKSPTVLHLATHGYFLANVRSGTAGISRSVLENNPMLRSMLFFAGAQNTLDKKPQGREDGILTAYEAQNLQLEGTELVVLSACKTAQGKIQNGEGVYGLQRALRIAGAQAVLMSLWDVDDKVGREFMTLFYEKWLGGLSKPEAFRATQLAIKKQHPQPFYWAGFLLME